MSRLDSFIRRMQAQRDCLNHVAPLVRAMPGPILEVGLGNGRTYDHLRRLYLDRDIYVFDRTVAAHPDCVPPADHLILGEAEHTLRVAASRFGHRAALIHSDLGTGDEAANAAMADWLAPALAALLAPGGVAVVNQRLEVPAWRVLGNPPGVLPDRYFMYVAGVT